MTVYAVGDIQGCYVELQQLLEQIRFDPAQDKLWLVGDLVNRGPDSLQVLRLVKSLGDSAISVLGNHDLHLLAVAEGAAELHRTDTLDEILSAPDRDELLFWLRQQKMLHAEGDYVLVHAGLLPQWSVKQAAGLAREVENALRGDAYATFLARMYGNAPHNWNDDLDGYKRLRVITNVIYAHAYLHAARRDGIQVQGRSRENTGRLCAVVRSASAQEPQSHRHLRPLVGAGAEGLAEYHCAGYRMPVGRPNDRDPARRPSVIPGELQESGRAKLVTP